MEEKAYGVIYKITNIKNNKVYIGQTTRKKGFNGRYTGFGVGIERVYNYSSKNGTISNKHLIRSIEKYGFESFEVDEEFDIAYSKDELNDKEVYWINHYNSTDEKYGYNKKFSGDNGTWTIETRKKILLKIGKPIICKNTNEVFISAKDVELKYGIPSHTVRNSANGKNTNCDMKFQWLKIGNKQPLIDIDTLETFSSGAEVLKKYHKKDNDTYRYCYKNNRLMIIFGMLKVIDLKHIIIIWLRIMKTYP